MTPRQISNHRAEVLAVFSDEAQRVEFPGMLLEADGPVPAHEAALQIVDELLRCDYVIKSLALRALGRGSFEVDVTVELRP